MTLGSWLISIRQRITSGTLVPQGNHGAYMDGFSLALPGYAWSCEALLRPLLMGCSSGKKLQQSCEELRSQAGAWDRGNILCSRRFPLSISFPSSVKTPPAPHLDLQ